MKDDGMAAYKRNAVLLAIRALLVTQASADATDRPKKGVIAVPLSACLFREPP